MNKRCLVWGMGKVFHDYINLIRYHEIKGAYKVMGVTSNLTAYSTIEGYPFILKEDINPDDYDFLIAMGSGKVLRSMVDEALSIGFKKEDIFTYKALTMREFDPDKYADIKRNTPTIFSNNCWGGMTYNNLGLEFFSPLINLAFEDSDYLRFLQRPEYYFQQELTEIRKGFETVHEHEFPICKCDDITIEFVHYHNMDNVNKDWRRRIARINWDNLLVEMYTSDVAVAEAFSSLPYEKKVCFVPFETDLPYVQHVELVKEMKDMAFIYVVDNMAMGVYPYYDPLVLLETGKIKKVADVR